MHLIPKFDGLNVESFIGHIQIAVNQHELFLCGIIAQKLTGRVKGTMRIDVTPNFSRLFEKLKYLFGKAQISLEIQRDVYVK